MNHAEIKQWCPNAKFIIRAYLDDHKFIYDGYSAKRSGAVANITSSKSGTVWGGMFEIKRDDLDSLDRKEGYDEKYPTVSVYDRKIVVVKDGEGNKYEAITYFRIGKKQGNPDAGYRQIVISGAEDCALPEDYIKDNL